MALIKEATISKWNCDDYTELPDSAPEGSLAHNISSGERYIFHDGNWQEDISLIYAMTQALAE